jgi:hypothetical protein
VPDYEGESNFNVLELVSGGIEEISQVIGRGRLMLEA